MAGHATETVLRAIQSSQDSLRLLEALREQSETVAKWSLRTSVADRPAGPKEPKSIVLAVNGMPSWLLQKHILLLLDDCLCVLQSTAPRLTCSSLLRRRIRLQRLTRDPDRFKDRILKCRDRTTKPADELEMVGSLQDELQTEALSRK
ncbi:hypothetical protein [Sinorhizobium meliloti]|uniref:hypothetical protein n=1 Tax=Rhizobium meliloti TaxID=382 RepID=UPI0013E37ACA|nr:hypothetical protein [Sinorhizobium meliloti]